MPEKPGKSRPTRPTASLAAPGARQRYGLRMTRQIPLCLRKKRKKESESFFILFPYLHRSMAGFLETISLYLYIARVAIAEAITAAVTVQDDKVSFQDIAERV